MPVTSDKNNSEIWTVGLCVEYIPSGDCLKNIWGHHLLCLSLNSVPGFVRFQLWYLNDVGNKEKEMIQFLLFSANSVGTLCTGGYKHANYSIYHEAG